MARLVTKTARGPMESKPQATSVLLCMCGLSKTQPFCDKSHLKTLDEDPDKLYMYDEDGKRHEVAKDCECDEDCDCKSGKGCDYDGGTHKE